MEKNEKAKGASPFEALSREVDQICEAAITNLREIAKLLPPQGLSKVAAEPEPPLKLDHQVAIYLTARDLSRGAALGRDPETLEKMLLAEIDRGELRKSGDSFRRQLDAARARVLAKLP